MNKTLVRKTSIQPQTAEDLKKTALIYWPKEIAEKEKSLSAIPLLLKTQESFISILKLANASHDAWIKALCLNKELYPNLFLKHLCVISDIGGESLKRYATELPALFKYSPFIFEFNNERIELDFKSLFKGKSWSNDNLGLDGKGIFKRKKLEQGIQDVSFLILFGSIASSPDLPLDIKERCTLGEILGNDDEVEKYVKQRYIWVSRQTGGTKSNALGYLIQNYLLESLKAKLAGWDFSKKNN